MNHQAQFLSDFKALDVTEGFDTHMLELEVPFSVYSGYLDTIITVPSGFVFDGESIPLFLQWLSPPFGDSKRGACVHDYLYRHAGYYDNYGAFHPVSRFQADNVYHELILANGLPAWRANIRYYTLRVAGWKAWNDNRALLNKTLPPNAQ